MSELVSFKSDNGISTITMDDGKANAMSVQMLRGLNDALDQAERAGGVVILSGREGILSGGFDLSVFKSGDNEKILKMLTLGAELSHRMLSFPLPIIAACTGHAVAMGTFILLCCDYRIGAKGSSKFAANEVAIGLTVPYFAIEVIKQRVINKHRSKAVGLAHFFEIDEALEAGFLDQVAEPGQVLAESILKAEEFLKLDLNAHTGSKLRLREPMLSALRVAIDKDIEVWKKRQL
ncbi:MAG: crotonase/enoyl-CoA hydratase family protein [Gammaproteobacteria bacterium]|nr:crotonase/enoyl-CoA hydratase family protein [Gammaproteobacteria bacterium]